jgi:hypothetical protein
MSVGHVLRAVRLTTSPPHTAALSISARLWASSKPLFHDAPQVPGTPLIGSHTTRPSGKTNALLMKPALGAVKQTTYSLPGTNHAYGKALVREDEGTGELLMNWMEHKPNPHAKPGRDFKALNKRAVVAGLTTAKAATIYRKTHDARLKIGTHESRRFTLADDFVHGKSTRPSTPMDDLISSAYRWSWVASHLEADQAKGASAKRLSSGPAATRASHGDAAVANRMLASVESPIKQPFVMKRFKDIPSKVSQYMGSPQKPHSAPSQTLVLESE